MPIPLQALSRAVWRKIEISQIKTGLGCEGLPTLDGITGGNLNR